MMCIFGTEHVYHSGFVFQCGSFEESPFKEHWSVDQDPQDQGLCTCEFVLDERWGWEVNSLGKHLIPVLFSSTCSTFLLLFSLSDWFEMSLMNDTTRLNLIVHIQWKDIQLYCTPKRESLIKQTLFQIQPLELIRLLRIIFYCCWENCEKLKSL